MSIHSLFDKSRYKLSFSALAFVVSAYIAGIISAELLAVFVGMFPSLLCHVILIFVLLGQYTVSNRASYRDILPALALAPLLRILSLVLPFRQTPPVYWHTMIGIPLLIGIILTARQLNLSPLRLGMHVWSWQQQLLIACSGIPLSIAAFLILQPVPEPTVFNWRDAIIGSASVLLFTGLLEELLFRGVLLQALKEASIGGDRKGILYSSALFATMYIGSMSWKYILFIGLVGLFFGWCVNHSGSIWGAVLAHSLINIGVLYIWPFSRDWFNDETIRQMMAMLNVTMWLITALALGLAMLELWRRCWRAVQ